MTAKIEIPNFGNLIDRYLAGETINELSREVGVNYNVLFRRLVAAGIKIRPRKLALPNTLIDRYLAGESEQSLSIAFNVNRMTIRRRLLEAGIKPRTISDTMFMRWQTANTAQREAMLAPAHRAARGRKATVKERETLAISKQSLLSHASLVEYRLTDWLLERGCVVTQQKAIGIYNVDLAIEEPRIAIEIFGGHFHAGGRHGARFFERTKYLLDSGWSVLIIWVDARNYPLDVESADYVMAQIEVLRLNPTLRCQYWVIRGDGKLAPVAKSYLNTPTVIERLRSTD